MNRSVSTVGMDPGSLSGLFCLYQTLEEQNLLQDWDTHESHRGREVWPVPLPRNAAPVRLDFETMSRPFFYGSKYYSSVLCFQFGCPTKRLKLRVATIEWGRLMS